MATLDIIIRLSVISLLMLTLVSASSLVYPREATEKPCEGYHTEDKNGNLMCVPPERVFIYDYLPKTGGEQCTIN